jgi:hypothetical protein
MVTNSWKPENVSNGWLTVIYPVALPLLSKLNPCGSRICSRPKTFSEDRGDFFEMR